nr:serine/threonine protein kinase [Deltaproteobacteria bacterium]
GRVRPAIDHRDHLDATIRSRPSQDAIVSHTTNSRYQLGKQLGAGGMAEVFVGTQSGVEGFAKQVAIKRVLPGFSEQPSFVSMFIAEARIASQLSHPNIVSVFDFTRDADARLFLVMEYVDGTTLSSLLESGPLPMSLVIFVVVEMLRGLGYAHDLPDPATGLRGVIHRDVSPQNLLVSYEGAVKVSDFGLAKALEAGGSARTAVVRGKPSYMSPEQANAEPLDGRSDLYAVGVMLWEMLAHRPLFVGEPREIFAQIFFKELPAPSSFRSRVPTDVEAIAMKLMARDRGDRYPTAEAAIEALLHCVDAPRDGRGALAHLVAERFPKAAASRSQRNSGADSTNPPRPLVAAQMTIPLGAPPKRRWRMLVGVASALMIAGVVGAVTLSQRSHGVTESDARPLVTMDASGRVASIAPVDAGSVVPMDAVATVRQADPSPPVDAAISPPAGAAEGAGSAKPVARAFGAIIVKVSPWAEVRIDGRSVGTTPLRTPVLTGKHRLQISNDNQSETIHVTVEPNKTVTVERKW